MRHAGGAARQTSRTAGTDYIIKHRLLEDENAQLKRWIFLTVIVAVILILAIVVWEHRRRIKRLKKENERLEKERKQVVSTDDEVEKDIAATY